MRKLTMLLFSLLAFVGVVRAQEGMTYLGGSLESLTPGKYVVYYQDADGAKHYLKNDKESARVVSTPSLYDVTLGNVNDGYAPYAYFFDMDASRISNPTNDDAMQIQVEVAGKEYPNNNYENNRQWESQVIFKNADGKYAIRTTNCKPGSGWRSDAFITISEDGATVKGVQDAETGDIIYKWTIEKVVAKIGDVGYATLQDAIDAAILLSGDVEIEISAGTYAVDINLTNDAVTTGDVNARPNITFKATESAEVVLAGTTTLGYRVQNVGASMWNGKVSFNGITFEHAETGKHSLDIQDVKGIFLTNCKVIGDGEYGIGSNGSNATPEAAFTSCTFENGAMQALGLLSANLVVDKCVCNDFSFNAQGGTTPGLTIKNSTFNLTLTDAHNDQSFYVVRSNANPINIKNTKVNIDSEMTFVAENQAKWALFFARKDSNSPWNIDECELNLTDAAMEQTELLLTKNEAKDQNGPGRITITNLTSESNEIADLVKRTSGYASVNGTDYKDGELDLTKMVAMVDGEYYETLISAIEAVADGGTVTLIKDEVFTATNYSDNGGWRDGIAYSGDKSFTIDLDGHTVSQDGSLNDYLFWFKNVGTKENTITIKNGTLDAGTTAYCALCTASSHENKLTINTEDLNLVNNISNGSTVKIRANSVYNAKSGTKITGKNSYLGIENWNAIVNIYDGTEIYMNGTSSYNGCLVGVGGGGTINVYGGYGKGVKGCFIAMTSGGTINISGGEWIANTDGTIGDNSNLYVLTAQSNSYENGFAGGSYINVTGGTFRGGMDAWVLNNKPEEDADLAISGGNFNANPGRWVTGNSIVSEKDGIYTVAQPVAKIGETCYATLEDAFKAATSGCTIDILSDVTITEYWDARNTGAKFTVPVTINGNDKTIKFTNTVYDGGNYFAAFRFEADATVNNLTIDMSEAVSGFGGRFRAISSKGNLTVDGCTFIGNGADNNTRAIIFGEGAGTNASNLVISVVDSEFINWRRGISDNENAQDVKEVTVTGNTLTNAAVYVSATDNVTFTDNTVEGAYVDIRSYTENNELNVTATGNTLEENTEKDKDYNYIDAGGSVEEEGFKTPVAQIGKKNYALLAEAISAAHKATDKVTITLKKDITVAKSISINKLVTIDLNGKAISSAEGYVFEVTGGELVLQGEGSIGAICYIINDADYKAADKTFALTEDKISVDIVYNRTFGHTSWQVLYVPFDIPVENMEGFEVYSISNVTNSGVVIEQVVEGDLSANTPYIIKATEAGNKTINVTDATLSVPVAYEKTYGNFTINGTYSSMEIDAESQYVLTNGLWCQLSDEAVENGNNILGAFRVYLTANGAPSEVRFVINNSDATAIDELKAENGNVKAEVYDLSGRRVEKAVKGIYVVNGVKVIK